MKRFAELQLEDTNAMVIGKTMLGFITCLRKDSILPLLEKHGLTDINPEAWYPLSRWLNVLREIRNSTYDLVSIGMSIIDNAPFPESFATMPFQDILAAIDVNYRSHHQGDVGTYDMQFLDDHHAVVEVNIPYPDDLVYGSYWQLCRKFLPPGTQFAVAYDTSEPIRKEGGSITRIHITW